MQSCGLVSYDPWERHGHTALPLSDTKLKALTPREKAYTLADGEGLYRAGEVLTTRNGDRKATVV